MSSLTVRQGNDLIEASYKIASIGETRLLRLLIAQIQPMDEEFKTYRISVADFARVFELDERNGNVYTIIDQASDALRSRKITIRDGKSWLHMNWLSSAKYVSGTGYVDLKFDPELKPYLLQLKGYYTAYGLENAVHFKSLYSVRLYELLMKEAFKANSQGKFTRVFEYEDVRRIFGVEPTEYKQFGHFNAKVISVATKEINAFSSLTVTDVRLVKTGRKVTALVFHVEKKPQGSLELVGASPVIEEKPKEAPPDVREMVLLGIEEATAYKWRKKYGAKRVTRNVGYTKAMQKAGKIRDSVTGFLARAIADDLAGGWEQEEKRRQKLQQEARETEQKKEAEEKAKLESEAEKRAKLEAEFYALSEVEQEAVRLAYQKDLGDFLRKYWEKGRESGKPEQAPTVRVAFFQFFDAYRANTRLPV